MKILVLLFSLFFSINTLAQVVGITEYTTEKPDSVQFILDGLPVSRKEAKSAEIIASNILTGEKLGNLYINRRLDTLYVLVTEKFASSSYKYIFSGFSKEYRKYLNATDNNDKDVIYRLNGHQLEFLSDKDNKIKKLYRISSDTIKKVRFHKMKINGIFKPTVEITTK